MSTWFFRVVLLAPFLASLAWAADDGITEQSHSFGSFGKVTIYQKGQHPKSLVMLASGDGGWNLGVVDMARAIVDETTVVVGFDTVQFLKNASRGKKCLYPAGELELLSKYVQTKLGFKEYERPALIGYSSGASLVYGALAQAPENTFSGAVSLGFCSDLPTKIPFCKGFGLESRPLEKGKGFDLLPSDRPLANWKALHGDQDKACSLAFAKNFVSKVKGAELVTLPKVGHGFSVQKNWLPQMQASLAKIRPAQEAAAPKELNLPLIPLSAENSSSDSLVIFLSGDGGWAGFDKGLSEQFLKAGVPVIGWNSLRYFWSAKSPQQGAADLESVLTEYLVKWKKRSAIVVGFSFGADVAAFFVNRLSPDTRAKISKVVLLAPGKTAEFRFHFADWLRSPNAGEPLLPEVKTLAQSVDVQCLYGEDEEAESVCPQLKGSRVRVLKLPGGHHFDADISEIYRRIR